MNQYSAYSLISMLNGYDATNLGSAYSFSAGQPPGMNFNRNRNEFANQQGYNQPKMPFNNKNRNYNGQGWGVKTDPEQNVEEINVDHSLTVLDHYNSDLNMLIDQDGYGGSAMTQPDGFCFCWAGARATYGVTRGKVFFEVHITDNLPVNFGDNHKETDPYIVRIGWSIDSSCFQLGESLESYGYGGTGKFSVNLNFSNYGERFGVGDVIGSLLDLQSHPPTISFTKNGRWFGNAKVLHGYPVGVKSKALFPHVLSKNCRFKVNFGQTDAWFSPPPGFVYIDHVPLADRVRGLTGPCKKTDCEINMIVGLPGAGKTTLGIQKQKNVPDKRYNIIGTDTLIDKMRVMGLPRKNNYHGRWEVLIDKSTKCLNKLFEIASRKRRNYILDQTNVYPSARKRKLRFFEGFYRRAWVIIPENAEFERRSIKRTVEDGKHVPEDAVLEMKANFTLPDADDPLDSIEFVELARESASVLVDGYRKEGREKRPPKQQGFRHHNSQSYQNTSTPPSYSTSNSTYNISAQRKISDTSAAVYTAAISTASVQPVASNNPERVKQEIGVDKVETYAVGLASGMDSGKELSQAVKQEPFEKIDDSNREKTARDDQNNRDNNTANNSKPDHNNSSTQVHSHDSRGHDSRSSASSSYDRSRDRNSSRDKSRGRDKSRDDYSYRSRSRDRYRGRDRSRDRYGRDRSRDRRYRSRDRYHRENSRDRYYSRDRSRDRYRDSNRNRYRDRRPSRERSYDRDQYQRRDGFRDKSSYKDQQSFKAEKQENQYNTPYTDRQNNEDRQTDLRSETNTGGMSYHQNRDQPYSPNTCHVGEPFKEANRSTRNDFNELFGSCDVDYRVPASNMRNQATPLTNQNDTNQSNTEVKQPTHFTNNSSVSDNQQWQTSSINSSNPQNYNSAYQSNQQLGAGFYSNQYANTAAKNCDGSYQRRDYSAPHATDKRPVPGSNYDIGFYNRESSDTSIRGNTFENRKIAYSSDVNSLKNTSTPSFQYDYQTSIDSHSQNLSNVNQNYQQTSQLLSPEISRKSTYNDGSADITFPAGKDCDLRFNQQDRNYLSFLPPSISNPDTSNRNEVSPAVKAASSNSSLVPNLPLNNTISKQDKMFDNTGISANQHSGLASSNNWQKSYNENSEWNKRDDSTSLPSYQSRADHNEPGKESKAFPSSNTGCLPPNFNRNQFSQLLAQIPSNLWSYPVSGQMPFQSIPGFRPGLENQSDQRSRMPPSNPPRF